MRKNSYKLIERGSGFHGYALRAIPKDVKTAASAVVYLASLAAELGHLSGTRSRDSDIDWREMHVGDHAYDEWKAMKRIFITPALAQLAKKLRKTAYGSLAKEALADITSIVFHESFDRAFRER